MSVFVIAEAGVNHNGSLRDAEKLIVAAKRCGADAVKFQLFDAALLKRQEIAHLQISREDMAGLKLYADRQGIEFMCTPFDVGGLWFLAPHLKRLKIGSGSLDHISLLTAARDCGLPIILSTGMTDRRGIIPALDILGSDNVTLLHCTSSYPCPDEDVNLRAMDLLPRFGCKVGYSDHTTGIIASIAAAARGATVIEKHLTLDCDTQGPDHASSIEPPDFKMMVDSIREVEIMLGDGVKRVMPSEAECVKIWRQS